MDHKPFISDKEKCQSSRQTSVNNNHKTVVNKLWDLTDGTKHFVCPAFFFLELIVMPLFLWRKPNHNTKYPIPAVIILDIKGSNSCSLSISSKKRINLFPSVSLHFIKLLLNLQYSDRLLAILTLLIQFCSEILSVTLQCNFH